MLQGRRDALRPEAELERRVTSRVLRLALAVPLLAIGLGTASAAARAGPVTPLCVQAASAHHVGIVVEHGDGRVVRQCVGFATATITALAVLQESGIEEATQSYGGSLGEAVCQIDHEPVSYTSCLPMSGSYWVLFISRGGGAWGNSAQGVSNTTMSDGDDVGFRYDPLAGADPPPVSPAGTCATTTPTPTPTAASTPTPTPHATPPAGSSSTATPAQATARAPSTTSSAPFPIATEGATAGPSGSPSPDGNAAVPVSTVAPAATIAQPFVPGLLLAGGGVAALVALLGVQGLRRRRR
jgi:hypothetical protein